MFLFFLLLLFQAACGFEKKPEEKIVDIDSADAKNDLAAVEYVEDIYSFYKSVEVSIIHESFLAKLCYETCINDSSLSFGLAE